MEYLTHIVHQLRQRPLHQRHMILWAGSLIIFVMIFWLWLFQVKTHIASFSNVTQVAQATEQEQQEIEGASFFAGLFDVVREGSASLFSLFEGEQEPAVPFIQEGNELDQFLPYEPFPQ
jgi:hypothetical protein